jgi:tRNA nucleotidyltransferase (CCA-adding enzyme)
MLNNTDSIYKNVLKKYAPSSIEREKLDEISQKFLSKLNGALKKHFAKAVIGGSLAKDTWLTNNNEVDVFVQFDYNKYSTEKKEQISDILKDTLLKTFPKLEINKVHGSRDYYQMEFFGILFETIPIIKINEAKNALNITDISPLHADWVNKNSNKKLKNEIRLTKQFLKAQKLYGAESYLSSFSGYVSEILTIYYGSFEELLKSTLKWKDKVIIDPEKYHKKMMVHFELNKSKLQSPIIIVDPTDKYRNAAAALSIEKFKLFKKRAKEFLKNPSCDMFDIKKIDIDELKAIAKKKKLVLTYIELEALEGKRDVIGAKFLKVYNYLKKMLKDYDIKLIDWEWSLGKPAKIYFMTKKAKRPKKQLISGPPIVILEHAKEFQKKHKNWFEKEGRLYVEVDTKHPNLDDYVKFILETNYCKIRYSGIKSMYFNL